MPEQTIGSRAQVMHGNAKKTSGGLTKKQLKYNKQGKIVSKKASALAKKNNRLVKAGYVTKKGIFGSRKMRGGYNEDASKELQNYLNDKNPKTWSCKYKIKRLINQGADPNISIIFNSNEIPLLYYIIQYCTTKHSRRYASHDLDDISTIDIVRTLLEKGANPNIKNSNNGDTPLHIAVKMYDMYGTMDSGYDDIVRLLLQNPENPGNPNIQNNEGDTPLDIANNIADRKHNAYNQDNQDNGERRAKLSYIMVNELKGSPVVDSAKQHWKSKTWSPYDNNY